MTMSASWFYRALLSAAFAALKAIFAKIFIHGVGSDLATLVRAVMVIVARSAFVWLAGKWGNPCALSRYATPSPATAGEGRDGGVDAP